jgi:uncharacterized UPF0146 family protein
MGEWIDVIVAIGGSVVTVVVGVVGYLYGRLADHEVRLVRIETEQKSVLSLLREVRDDVKDMKETIDRANI